MTACMDWAQSRTKLASCIFLLLTVCASTWLLAARIHQGFDPADDPVLAHAAERVLHGEQPHVDFHDVYTGGLSYLDAAAFPLFGTTLLAPRIMLLIFFVPAVAALWYIASTLLRPAAASLVTLVAVVWSVPQYPSPIGSWYNLYFAVFATAALCRYLETCNRRWIFLAGISGGLSILFKITGIYLVAAGVLFLLFEGQSEQPVERKRRLSAFSMVVIAALLLFCAALIVLIRSHPGVPEYYQFVLPGVALAALLIGREWQCRSIPSGERIAAMARHLLLFLAGVCVPVAAFLVPYLAARRLGPLFQDVFVAPFARIHSTFSPPIGPIGALASLILFELIAVDATLRKQSSRRIAFAVSCLGCALAFYLSLRYGNFLRWTWVSAAASIPLLCVVAVVSIWQTTSGSKSTSRLFLLVAMTAMCSLVQFPFSGGIYFSYVAPLLVLALAALTAIRPHSGPSVLAPVALFFLFFAVFALMPNQIYSKGLTLQPDVLKPFAIPRAGGILGGTEMVDRYERVCAEIAVHTKSAYIYTGPDSAGLYFLAGRENATPIIWDFLAGDDNRPERVLGEIERAGVNVAVISHSTYNPSGPLPPQLLNELRQQFPNSKMIDNFEVRWR